MRRSRLIALITAAALLPALALVWLGASSASAHGTSIYPASRYYACYVDGLRGTGEIIPINPACAAAVAQGGTQPLYDWYGVLRSDGQGRTAGYIPDGKLCSADTTKYAAFDAARADWPATNLSAGQQLTLRYGAWVPHPGSFKIYVSKQGYDVTKPLTWADLGDPIATFSPQPGLTTGPNGQGFGEYDMTVTLPSDRTGRQILYVVWYRSDSQETFYGCSDVDFGGAPGPSASPSPSASPGPSGTPSPGPSAGPTPEPSTGPSPSPAPAVSCSATVTLLSTWDTGYQAEVSITDTGTAALNDWYVSWTMPPGSTIGSGWSGTYMQSGTTAMVHAPSYANVLAAGGTTTAGFLGTKAPSDPAPTFTNVTCG